MTSATFAARASAGIPPSARDAQWGSITGPGRARRTAAKLVRTVERRYPVSSARRAVSVPGSAGRLLHPRRPNRCSRRSPGPSRPRPGAGRSLHRPRGVAQNRRTHSAAGPGCRPRRRPSRRTRPPDQTSPNHQRSPWSRTCRHHYSHRPLRPLLRSVRNRHSHSWLPSSRRPRLKSGLNHRPCPRSGPGHRLRSYSIRLHPRLGRHRQPRPQHRRHRSPRPPGPC